MGGVRGRTLMRHFVGTAAVATLTFGMGKTSPAAALITLSRRSRGRTSGLLRARRTTVDIASVATAANEYLGSATGAGKQTGGVLHRPLLPMRTGLKTPSWRYLLSGRASHGSGGAVPDGLAGQGRCRTCLNGSDRLHQYLLVCHLPLHPLACLPGATRQYPCSPASMAIDRVIHQLCAQADRRPQQSQAADGPG